MRSLAAWEPWLRSTAPGSVVAELSVALGDPGPGPLALWEDFEQRAAGYYALLSTLVPGLAGAAAETGVLPAELAERIASYPLDKSLLRVNLRGYQRFSARFALNQCRAVLGDEMGLGKTVQAIAALAHLAAGGARRFLVVCPASVLVNWSREIHAHNELTVHRIHGPAHAIAARQWRAGGGVALTTFASLHHVPRATEVAMLVVDEAHFVKNPRARRSRAVARWARRCARVLLMTGTPLTSRLTDFIQLIGYVQPELVGDLPAHLALTSPERFRRHVARAYLRRNQRDVLLELPDLIVTDHWAELSPAGERHYRRAVASGNFMAMRRADLLTPRPTDSVKLTRLREIVAEAAENGHKIVVFSFFRDVLDRVAVSLGELGAGPVLGPLTDSVPRVRRQQFLDELTAAPAGATLVAQIHAGGVGLNIQAASVVVLLEPQLVATTEAQAIARVHRMGQVRTVTAHRLLVGNSVDERLVELLDTKEEVFDTYVRRSSLARGSVAAVDVTEAELTRRVVAQEQARLGYGPVWDGLLAGEE